MNNAIRAEAQKNGFSLIEILIAVAIIAIMAGVVGPRLFSFLSKTSQRKDESNIATLKQAVNSYYANTGSFPQNLEDLVVKPEGISRRKWGGPYIGGNEEENPELPKDSDGNDFIYEVTDAKRGKFKIYSASMEESEE